MHKESSKHEEIVNTSDKNENTNSSIQRCKFCTSTFETTKEYLTHIETTHKNSKSNSFMCSVCGKQYRTKNELTHHINSKCGTVKQFKCKICGQELMSAGSLYNHMLRHSGVRSFMCRFCAKLFYTAGQLKVHERIHTQDKAYVCEVCNKGFCHRQSLITHSTLHTGIKPFQCENCGNSFSCVGNLMKHRKTHADSCGLVPLTTHRVKHPSTKIKIKINTPANSRLKTREKENEIQKELENLKTELIKDSIDPKSNNIPPENSQDSQIHNSFQNSQDIQTVEKTSDKPMAETEFVDLSEDQVENVIESTDDEGDCVNNTQMSGNEEECKPEEASTASDDRYKYLKMRYVKKKNGNDLETFIQETNFEEKGFGECKHCGKRYTNVRWFCKHVKDHENSLPSTEYRTAPLHKCSCCKSSFYTKEECTLHQQTNHADLLTCYDCEKIFANRDSLRSHQKVFHKGVGRKAYVYICDKCGKQYKQKSYLIAHGARNCDKGPFYECSICQKQFSSVYTRNNHMRVHDPEKKLLCKFCAKSFHWKGQLKIHERSHTGEKPFACLYCPKAFAYRESLITHSSIHTGIKPHLCEGCGSRFSCIGNLIKHRSSHASECGAWAYKSQKHVQDVDS